LEQLIRELLQHYFDDTDCTIEPVPFGLSNLTNIVKFGETRYVARVYDPQTKNARRLRFEIGLIAYLERCGLSFEVPGFLTARNCERYVVLSNGRLGAVVRYIQGEPPDPGRLEHAAEMGRTTGQLSAALGRSVDNSGTEPDMDMRFHQLDRLHPLSGVEAVALLAETIARSGELDVLPMQIVHHDLLMFNLLIGKSGRMTGVLDFDFASKDARALELAVCLNHLLQFDDQSLDKVNAFLKEYTAFMTLTPAEIEALPFLMKMYYVSLLTIYIGQHASGKDVRHPFTFILEQMCRRTEWLEKNAGDFMNTVRSYF
jgi:Ser/Thr protein kinase RdoA (MazF antagonist)